MARFVLRNPLRTKLVGTSDDDLVTGSRRRPWLTVRGGGFMRLRGGDDRVIGRSPADGDNTKSGGRLGTSAGIHLHNGVIRTGSGDDVLKGIGTWAGIRSYDGWIHTGKGDDRIIGRGDGTAISLSGSLDTGPGDDVIVARRGTTTALPRIGLSVSLGSVDTGKGDDRIVAYGRLAGIVLDEGGIGTGKGNDTVDVRKGGLATGYHQTPWIALNLGRGDDRFIGFAADPHPMDWTTQGPAQVRGGRGTDTLVLPPGDYTISGNAVIGERNTLMAPGFELLEAFGGGSRPFADGTYRVSGTTITTLA